MSGPARIRPLSMLPASLSMAPVAKAIPGFDLSEPDAALCKLRRKTTLRSATLRSLSAGAPNGLRQGRERTPCKSPRRAASERAPPRAKQARSQRIRFRRSHHKSIERRMIMAVAASPLLRTPAFSASEVTLENDQMAADSQRAARSRRAFAPAPRPDPRDQLCARTHRLRQVRPQLAEFLASRGHSVEVVTAPPHYPGWFVRQPHRSWWYSRERMRQVAVTRCPIVMKTNGGRIWRALAPLTFAICAAPMVVWRILRSRPDVVLCIEPTLFSFACGAFCRENDRRARRASCAGSRG